MESQRPLPTDPASLPVAEEQAPPTCASCHKSPTPDGPALLKCASCRNVSYCNHDCQKADWKTHKKDCTFKPKSKSKPFQSWGSSSKSAVENILGLDTKTLLKDKPEQEVFQLLVDSYRMRVEDEYTFRGDVHIDSALGDGNPTAGFRRYLKKAETQAGLMPGWWSAQKREACVAFGCRKNHWWRLDSAVEKSDIQEHYGDPMKPMQLRMLAEQILGSNVTAGGPGLP